MRNPMSRQNKCITHYFWWLTNVGVVAVTSLETAAVVDSSAWPRESTIKHSKLEATTVAYIKEFIEFLIFCLEFEKHLCHFLGPPLKSWRWSLSTHSLAEFMRLGHAKSRKQTDYKLHMNWDKKATYHVCHELLCNAKIHFTSLLSFHKNSAN